MCKSYQKTTVVSIAAQVNVITETYKELLITPMGWLSDRQTTYTLPGSDEGIVCHFAPEVDTMGAFFVPEGINRFIPEYLRNADGWYDQEMCFDAAALIISLPEFFSSWEIVEALKTMKGLRPEAYDRFISEARAEGNKADSFSEMFDNFIATLIAQTTPKVTNLTAHATHKTPALKKSFISMVCDFIQSAKARPLFAT
jgi:hypothetical protein